MADLKRRPIAVFDSGLGGLTTVRALRRLLPGEPIVYFGDTGRVPYGGRSVVTITHYALQDAAFLNTFDPKLVIAACGTVSSIALDAVRQVCSVPVLGVVEPAARAALSLTRSGKVGLLGTAATIRSGAYERAIASLGGSVTVYPKACPLFVPLVENGRIHRGDIVTETVVAEYLAPLKDAGVDTLILGCTHYPLLSDLIGDFMGGDTALVDVGEACVRKARAILEEHSALSDEEQGQVRYFVSDTPNDFAHTASLFLGEDISNSVEEININHY